MIDFITEGGWGMYPVLVFGGVNVVLAVRHARAARAGDVPLLVGVGVATLMLGVLGTITGVQASARYIDATPDKWLFLMGLRESLNVMVAALVSTTAATLLATYGAVKHARRGELARAPSSA